MLVFRLCTGHELCDSAQLRRHERLELGGTTPAGEGPGLKRRHLRLLLQFLEIEVVVDVKRRSQKGFQRPVLRLKLLVLRLHFSRSGLQVEALPLPFVQSLRSLVRLASTFRLSRSSQRRSLRGTRLTFKFTLTLSEAVRIRGTAGHQAWNLGQVGR